MTECLDRVRGWNAALLNDETLDPGDRRGYIFARRALLAGLRAVYDNAGRDMPARLQQEIDAYQEL